MQRHEKIDEIFVLPSIKKQKSFRLSNTSETQTSGHILLEKSLSYATDLTQICKLLPQGGTDADKQNSSDQLVCVCLNLSHLAAIHRTLGQIIYYLFISFLEVSK